MPWPKGKPRDFARTWSKEQEQYVVDHYDGNGSELAKVLPFTGAAIRNKAKRLGVKNNGHFHNVKPIPCNELSLEDLYYIAGFFDGEGSIFRHQKHFRCSMANSDRDVIEWIHGKIGIGKTRVFKARKHQHLDSHVLDIFVVGEVWGFLLAMEPYLKIKKLKAQTAISQFESNYQ